MCGGGLAYPGRSQETSNAQLLMQADPNANNPSNPWYTSYHPFGYGGAAAPYSAPAGATGGAATNPYATPAPAAQTAAPAAAAPYAAPTATATQGPAAGGDMWEYAGGMFNNMHGFQGLTHPPTVTGAQPGAATPAAAGATGAGAAGHGAATVTPAQATTTPTTTTTGYPSGGATLDQLAAPPAAAAANTGGEYSGTSAPANDPNYVLSKDAIGTSSMHNGQWEYTFTPGIFSGAGAGGVVR